MHPSPTEPSDPGTRRLLLVVDAPSLLHRNHHARAHTRIKDRAGRPVWALHGMLRLRLSRHHNGGYTRHALRVSVSTGGRARGRT